MPPSDPVIPPSLRPVVLRSDRVECTVLAGKGADILSFVDRATGIDVLFKTPWGIRDPQLLPSLADSKLDWLARYPGGWQLLVPNAGDPQTFDNVQRGFHGEAATSPWRIVDQDAGRVELATELVTVPLRLTRTVQVRGPSLFVQDSIHNMSAVDVAVIWSEHPAFGPPFLGPGCRLRHGARTAISDDVAPGTLLAPGRSWPVDEIVDRAGSSVQLSDVPAPGEVRELFVTLTDFERGWFRLDSPSAGFGVELTWPTHVLPHAWFWQEMSATTAFPWFGRAHVLAVEPSNVPTGSVPAAGVTRQAPPTLCADEVWSADLELSRVDLTSVR